MERWMVEKQKKINKRNKIREIIRETKRKKQRERIGKERERERERNIYIYMYRERERERKREREIIREEGFRSESEIRSCKGIKNTFI